ncbi:MAG: DNA-3-methyladenine glycosylase [Acidobacteria bacterium]|nr:DNA-3-methyladenine glycosylase [Acidobacteriota bacterium]
MPNLYGRRPLPRSFYERDTVSVARDLLGTVVVHGPVAGRIVETEAYLGADDEAAHSFAGLTPRTRVIFGPPGRAYVYFTYGMHYCLNLVAEPEGRPGCVLLRALEPLAGVEEMFRRRPKARRETDLCSGPAKLTQALDVGLELYGADVTRGPLTVHPPAASDSFEIVVSPRIGITRSAALPLRFFIRDNEHVSRR